MKTLRTILMALAFIAAPAAIRAQAPADAPAATVTDLDQKYATDLLKAGTDAPDIMLNTIDGKPFALKDLRGRYVVLDFWASWCPDCRKDSPFIMQLYKKFGAKGVAFVGVSFDKNLESWKNGVAKLGIEYTQVSDLKQMRESPVAEAYHVKWIPTVYVIDPQGKVVLATVVSDKVSAYLHSVYPDCASYCAVEGTHPTGHHVVPPCAQAAALDVHRLHHTHQHLLRMLGARVSGDAAA